MSNIVSTISRVDYSDLISSQKRNVRKGALRSFESRKDVLLRLRAMIKDNEAAILKALKEDLGKPETEAYAAEILFLYNDIDHQLKHLKYWMRPERVGTSLFNQPGNSYIHAEPYGSVLVIAPWNYPIQLLIAPAIAAIAAGNAVVLKPSEISSHSEKLMLELINAEFDSTIIHVVTGGKDETEALIDARPDYIFFTGSTKVGSIIMGRAARYLIPVTLELGGKSPCIIHEDANMDVAVARMLWGKCMNAGQTCIAPDYVLVHENKLEEFLIKVKETLYSRYGSDILHSDDYCKIISQHHFDRITSMLKGEIALGGQFDKKSLKIEPTFIVNPPDEHPSMQEEIFGPILPVITYGNIVDAIQRINDRDKPLALYLFSQSSKVHDFVLENTSSGGVCINDTIVHIASNELPFGGVGASGFGSYHGKFGFDTFSHKKSVLKKSTFIDPSVRYPPYKLSWKKLERIFLWLAK